MCVGGILPPTHELHQTFEKNGNISLLVIEPATNEIRENKIITSSRAKRTGYATIIVYLKNAKKDFILQRMVALNEKQEKNN